jgi:hypothetical protein
VENINATIARGRVLCMKSFGPRGLRRIRAFLVYRTSVGNPTTIAAACTHLLEVLIVVTVVEQKSDPIEVAKACHHDASAAPQGVAPESQPTRIAVPSP